MRIFAALVWREIAERRLLLVASLLLGLVPIVLPWLPIVPARFTPEEIRTATVLAITLLFGGVTLVMLGSTIVGRDLSDRRLGFYFSRPIPSWTLWLSRLAAALALVVASILLMVAPTAVADAGSWAEAISDGRGKPAGPVLNLGEMVAAMHLGSGRPLDVDMPENLPPALSLGLGLLCLLLLLALTHAVSTIVRGRNLWVLADLAGLAVVLAVLWTARAALVREQALGALVWAERLLVPGVLGALVLAGAVQLAFGRIDLQRGHRYLSATLWPALAVVALAFGAYSRWVAASTLQDLEHLSYLRAAPEEQWLVAGGPVRYRAGARAAFLLEAESGRSWRLGSLRVSRAWLTFSPDGDVAVWVRCESFRPLDCRLWAKDLRQAGSPPRPTEIPIRPWLMRWWYDDDDGWGDPLTFNDDGTLLAIAENKRLVVYELGHIPGTADLDRTSDEVSARVVTAVAAKEPHSVTFLPGRRVRFHQRAPVVTVESPGKEMTGLWTQIHQLDLDTRQLTETGRLPPMGHGGTYSPTRDLLLYHRLFPVGAGVYDGETGVPLAEIDKGWQSLASWGRFLADGRLLVGHFEQGGLTLLVLSPEGQELHQVERAGVKERVLGGELSPGRLLIALREEPPPPGQVALHQLDVEPLRDWTTYVLDADSGTLSPLAAGVMPLDGAGTSADRLFVAGGGRIIRWNPDTGELRTIFQLS